MPLTATLIGALGALTTLGWVLVPLLLTFLCMYLLKKKVSAIAIILVMFVVGVGGRYAGIFGL